MCGKDKSCWLMGMVDVCTYVPVLRGDFVEERRVTAFRHDDLFVQHQHDARYSFFRFDHGQDVAVVCKVTRSVARRLGGRRH
jgi:hypothetical protein